MTGKRIRYNCYHIFPVFIPTYFSQCALLKCGERTKWPRAREAKSRIPMTSVYDPWTFVAVPLIYMRQRDTEILGDRIRNLRLMSNFRAWIWNAVILEYTVYDTLQNHLFFPCWSTFARKHWQTYASGDKMIQCKWQWTIRNGFFMVITISQTQMKGREIIQINWSFLEWFYINIVR